MKVTTRYYDTYPPAGSEIIPIVRFDSKDNFNYRSNPIANFGYKDTYTRK